MRSRALFPSEVVVEVETGSILSVESNQNVESKIAFGQLILRKIIKTVATGCQILRQKCTKIQNSAVAPPDPLAGFKGPTSIRGGEWRGRDGSVVESKKILKIDHE